MRQSYLLAVIFFNMKNNQIKTIKVAIIGQPNVGKSTLINSLVGTKISITSRKAQTTIDKETAVIRDEKFQIVLFDTPGILSNKHKISRDKFSAAMHAINESDLILLLFCYASLKESNLDRTITKIKSMNKKYIILLNKIDLLKKEEFVNSVNKLKKYANSSNLFSISALKNQGIDEIKQHITGKYSFLDNKIIKGKNRNNEKKFIQEIVREKILRNIHDEVPYNIKIIIDKFFLKKDSSYSVYLTIYLNKTSHKPILLGSKGRTIKKIGIEARKDLEKIFKKRYHLFMYVKSIKKIKNNILR